MTKVFVEVDLRPGDRLMVVNDGGFYRLGDSLNDVVAGSCISSPEHVQWCSITQGWVHSSSPVDRIQSIIPAGEIPRLDWKDVKRGRLPFKVQPGDKIAVINRVSGEMFIGHPSGLVLRNCYKAALLTSAFTVV